VAVAPASVPVADQSAVYDEAKAERHAAVWRAFDKLRKRANEGDRQARIALVRFCNANPNLWAMLGDTAKLAETGIIDVIANREWLSGRAIAREADQLRKRLSRPSQSPLEELAIRRLVACWAQLHLVDSMCGQADGAVERARFWLHRQAQAHKLYAAAEKSLLLIRGLIPAAVQPHDAVHADVMVEGCGNGKPHELADEMQQEASVTAESFTGVNCVAGRNGHASTNGKRYVNRLNGNRRANILETIGAVAEG
jgi:hypothetical protein